MRYVLGSPKRSTTCSPAKPYLEIADGDRGPPAGRDVGGAQSLPTARTAADRSCCGSRDGWPPCSSTSRVPVLQFCCNRGERPKTWVDIAGCVTCTGRQQWTFVDGVPRARDQKVWPHPWARRGSEDLPAGWAWSATPGGYPFPGWAPDGLTGHRPRQGRPSGRPSDWLRHP